MGKGQIRNPAAFAFYLPAAFAFYLPKDKEFLRQKRLFPLFWCCAGQGPAGIVLVRNKQLPAVGCYLPVVG
jgi:hypothetical protein